MPVVFGCQLQPDPWVALSSLCTSSRGSASEGLTCIIVLLCVPESNQCLQGQSTLLMKS